MNLCRRLPDGRVSATSSATGRSLPARRTGDATTAMSCGAATPGSSQAATVLPTAPAPPAGFREHHVGMACRAKNALLEQYKVLVTRSCLR